MAEYSKSHPYLASVRERYSLCRPGTAKETVHLELDLAGSGLSYNVGDSIAILPSNDPDLVQRTLLLIGASGTETVVDPKTGEKILLRSYLETRANLRDCTKKFIADIRSRQAAQGKIAILDRLLEKGGQQELKDFQSTHDVADALEDFGEGAISPQAFCELLKPMMPRFYSIASSQKAVGDEVHLTVALQKWLSKGRERLGVCSHFLCNMIPLNAPTVPVYLHPHRGFTLPEDSYAPIIMVGPGTGIAPFRAFMQEREALEAKGKNWLFFGEWNRAHHYFYEDYWQSLEQKGKLQVDLAFSRDQLSKVYVQHRLIEKGREIYAWLQEGAYFYVCGDAAKMAKDVEAALVEIIKIHGRHSEERAREYVKELRKSCRYLRDVY